MKSDLHILGAVLYMNTYDRRKPLFCCELTVSNPSVKLTHTKLLSFIHLHFHEKHWMNKQKVFEKSSMKNEQKVFKSALYTEKKKCFPAGHKER